MSPIERPLKRPVYANALMNLLSLSDILFSPFFMVDLSPLNFSATGKIINIEKIEIIIPILNRS